MPLKATLQTSFSQIEPIDVVVGADVEARVPPDLGGGLDPRCDRPGALAQSDELEAVVVDVPRCDHRGPEPAGDADRHALLAEHARRGVRSAETVLDREDERALTDQRTRLLGGRRHVHGLGRDDDQLGLARLGRIRGGMDADDPVAARPLDVQTPLADRIDVLRPPVDGPDLVAGAPEQAGVHRSHCAGADDGDLHVSSELGTAAIILRW